MYRRHHLDIYTATLHLVTTSKSWRKHARRLDMGQAAPDAAGAALTTCDTHTGRLHVTIWIDQRWHTKYGNDVLATAIHEAVHSGGLILDHIGQSYTGESEALAYLVDWIATWLRDQLP